MVTLLFRKTFSSKVAIVHVVLATPCGIKSEHMEPGGLSNECRSIQSEALLRGRTARKNQSQEEEGWPHIASVVAAIQAIAVAREVRADAYFIIAWWAALCWVAPPTGIEPVSSA